MFCLFCGIFGKILSFFPLILPPPLQTIKDNITLELGWSWDFWSDASTGNTALCLGPCLRLLNSVQVDYVVFDDLDPDDNLDEDQFESQFGLDPVTDPKEKAKRKEALKEAEAEVKKENKKYLNGKADWFEEINEFSNLPKDEFEKEKTGDVETYARGLLEPEIKPVDEISERYIESLLASRASVPASYSAVSAGLVSSVKNQKTCGSCVAFGQFSHLFGLEISSTAV